MQTLSDPQPVRSGITPVGQSEPAGEILLRVFELLDRADIRYCVLHGYERYPQQVKSDVDCVVDASPAELLSLLQSNRERIGAEVLRHRGYYFLLSGKAADGSRCFLTLDLGRHCECHDLLFYDGAEVLASRRRFGRFWIPAADVEFAGYLARTIEKGTLDGARAQKLTRLYQEDAPGCARQLARFWSGRSRQLICTAADSNWEPVHRHLDALRSELRKNAILRRPGHFLRNRLQGLGDRLARLWRPDGLTVVLLGPDGAGKSSLIHALSTCMGSTFAHCTCSGFAPSLRQLLRRPALPSDAPHGLPARSLPVSLIRAGFWFLFATIGYLGVRVALARSTLVLYDRHFVDILIDAKRYRYGGPLGLLRLIWRVAPKPDLVILLDAPPEVLQARKQEVPFEVTVRQRDAYLSLVARMQNGYVVDASKSLPDVTHEASEIILRQLAARVGPRIGSGQNVGRGRYDEDKAKPKAQHA